MLNEKSPVEMREAIRKGEFSEDTSNLTPGRVQANLVIVKQEIAFDFLAFCNANPIPCPVIEVTRPGDPVPKISAPGSDIRTDVGSYRVFKYGKLIDECHDIKKYWDYTMVAFLIGCSFSFDWILRNEKIPLRHIEENCTVPTYITNIKLNKVGIFKGTMVTTMRPFNSENAIKAIKITSRYPKVHGAPIHIGFPEQIGVNLNKPDFGSKVNIKNGEIPLFWGCGVTPQVVAIQSGVDFMITHSPAHMFLTDLYINDFIC